MIVTQVNPLENLTALRSLAMVMSQGKLISQPQVKHNAEVDRELDKITGPATIR